MGKTALITGLTGFVGSHLAEYLLAERQDVAVHGLLRWRSPRGHIIGIQDRVSLHFGDLRDLGSLIRIFVIPYDQCLRDILNYWRDQVSRGLA